MDSWLWLFNWRLLTPLGTIKGLNIIRLSFVDWFPLGISPWLLLFLKREFPLIILPIPGEFPLIG